MSLEGRAGSQCRRGHEAEFSEENAESSSGLEEKQQEFAEG